MLDTKDISRIFIRKEILKKLGFGRKTQKAMSQE